MSDIYAWINEHIDADIISTLQDYIRIPNQSRAFDPEWNTNGLNQKVIKFAKDFAEKLQIENLKIEVLEEKDKPPCILAILDVPNKPTVLMYGHLDKQPPLTEQWTKPLSPYEPKIVDNKLYGRGASDDGYAFFTSALLLKALQSFKFETNRVVLFFETDEESGSRDLLFYLQKYEKKIGSPDLVICLDSGCCDYEHFCATTTLRGVLNFTMKVEVTKEGVHSGMASGIIPDTFRIGRKIIESLESSENGQLYPQDFYVNVPEDKYQQAYDLIQEMGGAIDWKFPFLPGVKPTVQDGFKQYMNRIWMPQLTLISVDGVPNISNAGNVLRPFTTFGFSLRLPPTLNEELAQKTLKDFIENVKKPYNARVTLEVNGLGQGFNSPAFKPELKQLIDDAGQKFFGKPALGYGEGGSIPFINSLVEKFPKAQFIVTGVLGPESNAHGPDEFLHIPYLKKLACTLAYILQNYKAVV